MQSSLIDPKRFSKILNVIQQIHATNSAISVNVAGGGSHSISWLLSVPGASNTMISGNSPYCRHATRSLVNNNGISDFVTPAVAKELALASYKQVCDSEFKTQNYNLSRIGQEKWVGVGVTAALMSKSVKKGPHRCFATVMTDNEVKSWAFELEKGSRSRLEEEFMISEFVIKILADQFGIDSTGLMQDSLLEGDRITPLEEPSCPLTEVINGDLDSVLVLGDRFIRQPKLESTVTLAGSFNPLHQGHINLLRRSVEKAGLQSGILELTLNNPDKGEIDLETVKKRITAIREADLPVLVTNKRLFVDKLEAFRSSYCIMGYDTVTRFLDPKYYDNCYNYVIATLGEIKRRNIKIIVAGRKDPKTGEFQVLTNEEVPKGFESLFVILKEDDFREDISSTEIRAKTQGSK